MKFSIKHTTKLFYRGIILPWLIFTASLVGFIALGFDITYKLPSMILIGITVLCVAAELIFVLLYGIEGIFGTKIIVESDHITVKMLMRRKKLHFDDIADAKFSHYDEKRSSHHSRKYRGRHVVRNIVRSKLDYYLMTGKVFSLNDDAKGYTQKQKLWTADPALDPNEDIPLYQAYRCYCAASRQYYLSKQNSSD